MDVDTLVVDGGGTLMASKRLGPRQPQTNLPTLAVGPPEPGQIHDLELEETIGSGGMATVWAAAQPSLGRRVAVKELRPERRSEDARDELLREARLAGSLEHPNIVPIHTLGLTEAGWPVIVMKFIEGTPWSDALEPLYAEGRQPSTEALDAQLRVFMQICTAVDFAHDRGVIHRDLKPDNVMIGAFGEVYLVDWGLALQLGEFGHARPEDVSGVAGTLGYMAPEMVGARAVEIGRWTDVYLLGATLHELVLGERRNRGDSMTQALVAAHDSAPVSYPEHVPAELAQICNRATQQNPRARYPSAAALRDAVGDFLRHRSSMVLTEEADKRHARLREASEAGSIDPARASEWAGEARFGYRQALREWPENARARAGLASLLALLVTREIGDENLRAAEALFAELAELEPAQAELEAELEALRGRLRAREREIAEFAEFRHETSLRVNVNLRRRLAIINGSVLGLGAGGLFALRWFGVFDVGYAAVVAFTVLLTITVAVGGWVLDRRENNRVNRQVMSSLVVGCTSVVALFVVAWIYGMDIAAAESLSMIIAMTTSGVVAATIDRGMLWASLLFLVAAIAVMLAPDLRGLWIAVFGGGGFGVASWTWRQLGEQARQAEAARGQAG